MQNNETLYKSAISKRCNLIQRYNIWYNKPNISLRFSALFCSCLFYNLLIIMYLSAKGDIRFNTFNNKVLPKWGLMEVNPLMYFHQLLYYI
ncbi:hypothetical protein SAMN05421747_1378 [Parapedobacter composti]|uniref:Uncharacterized protein n=1 Tax=Parapedobacter composti TaxID=623281 RepID=A0A1I1MH20_9SPHI|nr:hypothetical protein SAMN05421747_1378 [Parapedobacter composti]